MKNLTIAGRIGKDAETRSTSKDTVTNFNVAVDRFKKDDGPLWVKVTLWGTRGEKLAQYLTKGKTVSVSGEMDLESYTNKNDEVVTQVILNANQVTLLGGGEKTNAKTREAGDEDEADGTRGEDDVI
jgi:single-strand DNA-binding protein